MYKCKNPHCAKTFPVYARISIERKVTSGFEFNPSVGRVIVEKPCYPFCESIEFEEIVR